VNTSLSKPVTELLLKWRAGDPQALQALMPLVYGELHRVAHRYLQGERPNHTLRSTELVHEAYLRLVDQKPSEFESRSHFLAVLALLMREILVDYARKHRAAKRGYGCKITLDPALAVPEEQDLDVLALDDALKELERFDAPQARVVELRFFGGLSINEVADVLKISPATVKREWATARAWLYRELNRTAQA
jgi:RNA polymerase sigma factor (TIGR02999 family)